MSTDPTTPPAPDRDALARVIAQAFYRDPLDPAEMDPDDLAAALRAGGEAADDVFREWPHLAATGPRDAGLREAAYAIEAEAAEVDAPWFMEWQRGMRRAAKVLRMWAEGER